MTLQAPTSLRGRAVHAAKRRVAELLDRPERSPLARLLTAARPEAVIDVGANSGQFAQRLRQGGYTGTIVSCEPVSATYAHLAANAAADPRWSVERVAVGAEAGSIDIHVSGHSAASSVLPMDQHHLDLAPQSAYVQTETVPLTTVDALLAQHGLDPATTAVKIDVQGFEWSVLDGASVALPQLPVVVLEMCLVTLYDGQKLLPDLLARMYAGGHVLWNIDRGYTDKANGRLWWCDGIYVRRDLAERIPLGRALP